MAIKHEELRPKIQVLHFKPEGYVSPGDAEYKDQFMSLLSAQGIDPAEHVFSGLSGKEIDPVHGGLPDYSYFYVMNLAGWNEAIEHSGSATPADYAMDVDDPCIAVLDRSQLAELFGGEVHINPQKDDMSIDPIELNNIKRGEALSKMGPERVVNEEVVHISEGRTPADALVALVYLDE